jgi:hypothetical protein
MATNLATTDPGELIDQLDRLDPDAIRVKLADLGRQAETLKLLLRLVLSRRTRGKDRHLDARAPCHA